MADSAQIQYDKMTKTPVNRLVLTLGLPTTVSMLITNLYNMADTFFVGQLGTSASGATGVVFGLMSIIQAFGFMLGHGAGSHISRQLGERHVDRAREYSATSFYLSLLCGSCIMVLGLLFQEPLMRLLGSTDSILPYAKTYSFYILLAAPVMTASCVLNNILRYEGKATYAMVGLCSGGLLNIAGDYVLINWFHMGIAGAGLSTAVSQLISAGILMIPFTKKMIQSSLSFRYMTRSVHTVGQIVTVGLPSLFRQGLNSISVMLLNQCAMPYGDAAIAAMSICSRVNNFLFCVGLGIGQGFQPVCGFNYGAKKYSRVREAFRFTFWFGTAFLSIMAALGFVFAKPVVTVFRDDPAVIEIGVLALRLHCISLLAMPITVCGNMMFQSIGKSLQASFLSVTRSGLIFIPVLLFTSEHFGLLGIQMSQPIADVLAALITMPLVWQFFRELPQDMPDGETETL